MVFLLGVLLSYGISVFVSFLQLQARRVGHMALRVPIVLLVVAVPSAYLAESVLPLEPQLGCFKSQSHPSCEPDGSLCIPMGEYVTNEWGG